LDIVSFQTLEFPAIVDEVKERCLSNLGKTLCERMQPSSDAARVRVLLQETTEAALLVTRGVHRIDGLHDVSGPLQIAQTGGVLPPADLVRISAVLRGAARFKKAMRPRKADVPLLCSYAESICELPDVTDTIDMSVDGDRVSDSADDELRKVRRAKKQVEARIQTRLSSLLNSGGLRDAIAESYVTVKNGRYVVPVKASHRQRVPGSVIAASSTGQTVFIEPSAIQPLVEELVTLSAQEEDLVYKVLCRLTEMVVDHLGEIKVTVEAMAVFDFVFAKGKYSLDIGGVEPRIVEGPTIDIRGARHPLLGQKAVPLDVVIGPHYRTLVVTGPNTGGKTVLLKTVGLLCLMGQSGLHIPASEGSSMPVFDQILADIGDRQSIEQSLSTFSSHMENIALILRLATSGSLVMLDEIGTGTDPREGAALAAAILTYLYDRGCVTLATTHYGDIKAFSESRPGFRNGCMEFDHETLEPLYKLSIGKSGESQGITIATRLGLPEEVIGAARGYLSGVGVTGLSGQREDAGRGRLGNDSEEPRLNRADAGALSACDREADGTEATDGTREIEATNGTAGGTKAPWEEFRVGDSVYVSTVDYHGIVAKEADSRGDLIVIVKDEHLRVNWKRLKLLNKREDLYPDYGNYDMNIVLMSKGDRKLVRQMARRHIDSVRFIKPDPE
jgi:DNA mismatch repair protein MutS2